MSIPSPWKFIIGTLLICLLVPFVADVYVYARKSSPEAIATSEIKSQEMRRDEAALDARKAQENLVMRDDISKCSSVTDEIRCYQAFHCKAEPEACVIEHGDPDIVLDYLREADMNDDTSRGDY